MALKTVKSPEISLPTGYSTYDLAPSTFQATCPAGYAVVGTGFSSSVASPAFVLGYGTFVGGFIYNDSGITVKVSVQAICAQVPAGTSVTRSSIGAARQFDEDAAAAQAAIR